MPNIVDTARELALAWIAADQWGEPTVSESYQQFFLDESKCPISLAESLLMNRSDLIIVRALASKQVAATRRLVAMADVTEEDGA